MEPKKALLIIVAIAFLLRAAIVLQAPGLSYEAYSTVRQVEHIKDTGLPLIKDTLQQRTMLPLPVFPYILAFATLFLPDQLVYLFLPNLLAALLPAALFYLLLELTNDTRISLLGAAASIFMPSYLEATLLSLSSLSLAIPLFIVTVLLYLKLRKTQERRNLLLGAFIILTLTHPIALILLPFIIFSLILNAVHRARGETAQQEFAVFSIFFLLWFNILLYRSILATIGGSILHANIPSAALAASYSDINLASLATLVGIIPFGLALYATYKESTRQHLGVQTIIALALVIVGTMFFKLLPLTTGLALFSAACFVLATTGIYHLYRYAKTLKHGFLPHAGTAIICLLFIITSVLPTVTTMIETGSNTVDPAVLSAAAWLNENSLKDSVVLASPSWGFVVETRANRQAYIDEEYLRESDVEKRYNNTLSVLDNKNVAEITTSEHIDYIMSSQRITTECVNTVYSEGTYIAKVLCS